MKKSLLAFGLAAMFLSACNSGEVAPVAEVPVAEKTNWELGLEKLHAGEVEEIAQTHSLTVDFFLKNGDRITAKESRIDEIFDEVDKCGALCADMPMLTE